MILDGGNSNQVRRHGDRVIRQCRDGSPFVHDLLRYLTANGFTESPVLIEATSTNETLTFMEGEVGNDPLKLSMTTDAVLMEAAQLLRRLHDVTQEFVVPADAQFLLPIESRHEYEVICHNDFAPYNCVFMDGHIVGIIDFDTAAPGHRIWDVAYAVYRFAPLMTDAHCIELGWPSPPNRAERLKKFCDAYGLENRGALVDTVIQRIKALIQFMRDTSRNLSHIPIYDADMAYIQANRPVLEAAIL